MTKRAPLLIRLKSLANKVLKHTLEKKYVLVSRNQDGVIKAGTFIPFGDGRYEVVDKRTHLVLPKGLYRIVLQTSLDEVLNKEMLIGMLVTDNSKEAYDEFWRSDQIIEKYANSNRVVFYRDILEIIKKFLSGRIIDVGCGSGDFLNLIRKIGIPEQQLYGVDFSQSAIERCREMMSGGKFLVGNIYDLNFPSSYFDCVICMEVLEHLEKPHQALEEMKRVCKGDGVIIITIPNGDYDDYIGHLSFWTEASFREFLGEFKLLDFRYLGDGTAMIFIVANQKN
ncbi:MAG: class I SAM-dependent methyltransferase [Paenibacillus sp.]|nr:class I SAM-dependent methyltransferase [Paenibacillus sp.]